MATFQSRANVCIGGGVVARAKSSQEEEMEISTHCLLSGYISHPLSAHTTNIFWLAVTN